MKHFYVLSACLLPCLGSPSSAKETNSINTSLMLSSCGLKAADITTLAQAYDAGVCSGYIKAAIDNPWKSVCLPDGITVGQAKDVYVKWLQDNPTYRDMGASVVVQIALGQAWPCPKP